MAKPNPVPMGKRTRMSFARIKEALEVPDLIEIQKNSYKSFLKDGLREVLADVSPITDYSESLILEFTDYSLDDEPKYTSGSMQGTRRDLRRAFEGDRASDQPGHP